MILSDFRCAVSRVRFGSLADISQCNCHVRFAPKCGQNSGHRGSLKSRALRLCPVRSNVDLLGNSEGIVHIDAEIPHSALYLGVTEQKLNGTQISDASID